jgi:hypothetical protein
MNHQYAHRYSSAFTGVEAQQLFNKESCGKSGRIDPIQKNSAIWPITTFDSTQVVWVIRID